MKNPEFGEIAREKRGCAVIFAGSDSDRQHIERIVQSLEEYAIPYEVRICSAHKDPEKLIRLVREYDALVGAIAYIAVAGGTDALSGSLSFHSLNPVISCPPDAPNQSCLNNPPGSANATINDPRNVGKFIAQMYAPFNPAYRESLIKSLEGKISRLEEKDRIFKKRYRSI